MDQKAPSTRIRLLLALAFVLPAISLAIGSGFSIVLAQSSQVTAFDLIIGMNTLRLSYGLPALIEDPVINAVAQATAQTMAASEMSSHIGDVRGRLAAAGYGGGATVWATENFAVSSSGYSIDEIMLIWSDADHMRPAVIPSYCHVGAGIAKSPSGRIYYILQAAYTSSNSCGPYETVGGSGSQPGGNTGQSGSGASTISQIIIPVKIATPDADGKIYHIVEAGQSFWAIAITYKITIKDIEIWNNISRDSKLLIGQRLFIPGRNTAGYATPTPVGMIQVSTPDADGRIIHTVQAYQTLTTISQAYGVSIQTILNLNGIQVDWPLQIEQKLVIDPGSFTPSPTPRPLTPIEKLTPAADGKYYHTVSSGENLSGIAKLYEIQLFDLMTWNGLNESSILQPDQKLLLQIVPPATVTPTPGPATATPIASQAPPSPTVTPSLTGAASIATPAVETTPSNRGAGVIWFVLIGLALGGLLVAGYFWPARKKK
jgi:LysM repeat protein